MLQIFTFFQLEKHDFDIFWQNKDLCEKLDLIHQILKKKISKITKISQQVPAGSQNT
jgi:hypothetical protein